jgi:16S rRNA C967 or C1407 C5-methylase (RsmB/RsmF family)
MLRQAANLFPDRAERDLFIDALVKTVPREQAIIIMKDDPAIRTFPRMKRVDWQPAWVERLSEEFRPGQHPLYQKGCFYPLDFSSVFSASAMLAATEAPRRVLDLCASPGGKSVFCYRAFKPETLIANETIRKRTGALIANFTRCHIEGSHVWSADPSVYAKKYGEAFDMVIVDAPCTGQSLLAKGDDAPGAFSPQMIDMNVGRQRRIAGTAAQCLLPGGYLFYSTCTFSIKENEKLMTWLQAQYPELKPVEVPLLAAFQSRFVDFPCYRLFPHQGFGAGAFACLLRRDGDRPEELPILHEIAFSWKYGLSG